MAAASFLELSLYCLENVVFKPETERCCRVKASVAPYKSNGSDGGVL